MPKTYVLLAAFVLFLGACAMRFPSSQETLDPKSFPITFAAAGLKDTQERYVRAVDPNELVAFVGIWEARDGGPRRAYIQAYHYPKGTYGNTRPNFQDYLPSFEPAFRNKSLVFGLVQLLSGHDGNIYYQTFSFDNVSCVAFFEHVLLRESTPSHVPGDGEVNGYYCAPRGETLTETEARDFLSSLRHKDARKRTEKIS